MELNPEAVDYVGAPLASSGCVELGAMTRATLWALQSQYPSFNFAYDSKYAELMTAGLANPTTNHVLCNIACGLRQVVRASAHYASEHILGTAGTP